MRNYFAIAFTCVYLTLTVGVAKTTHYCMGREKHSSIFSFSTEKCGCYFLSLKGGSCCADEQELIKIDDDQSGGSVLATPVPEFSFIGELHHFEWEVEAETCPIAVDEANPPPPKIPLYQSFCSLVFYDSLV